MNDEPEPGLLSADEKSTLLGLSRLTMQKWLVQQRLVNPDSSGLVLSDALKNEGAAFVTLTIRGRLRGCIGHVIAIEPLYRSVMHNTIAAATEDPRFPPVTLDEEREIHIDISVMSPLRDLDAPTDIVIGRDGLIIEKDGRRGLLLPQVASEYGWDASEFLEHTCHKAGLPPDAWRKGAHIQAFSAQVFGEESLPE